MAPATDQFSRYREALATGKRIEWERGDPASGFYKRDAGKNDSAKTIEAIAIYRDEDGKLQCLRDVFGDGSKMDADKIDELFAQVSAYPIPEAVYRDVTEDGKDWPPEYATRLSLKETQAGVLWTPELGRKKLGLADNPRAVAGGNNPPEATENVETASPAGHTLPGEQTPDKVAFAYISTQANEVKTWLGTLKDGKPQCKADADKLADYSTKFAKLHERADAARKTEKQPHLDAGRDVDDRWRQPIADAATNKKNCKDMAQAWRTAEDARRAEEARKANERTAAEAEQRGEAKPEAIQAERVGGLGNIRTVAERETVSWIVTDARAYIGHLIAGDGEVPAELAEVAGKLAQRRAMEAPGVERRTERRAA